MPADLTDSSAWEPIAVPVDADPANAASVETPFQQLADRTRWLMDDGTRYAGIEIIVADVAEWSVLSRLERRSEADGVTLAADLTTLLPRGAELTSVAVRLRPGAARAGADRMQVQLQRVSLEDALNITATTTLESAFDSGAMAAQWVVITPPTPHPIADGTLWRLAITAGNDAGTNKDRVAGFRVTFEPPA